MSSKNVKKSSKRWTQEETELFAEMLLDLDLRIEKLALKRFSNNEVFMHIHQEFMNALKLDSFKKTNEKNFQDKNGTKMALFRNILNWH